MVARASGRMSPSTATCVPTVRPAPPPTRPSRPRRRAVPTPSLPVWSVGRACLRRPAFAGCRLACGPARIFAGPVRPTYQCTGNPSRSRSAGWPRAPLLAVPIIPPRTVDPIPSRRLGPAYQCTDNPSTTAPVCLALRKSLHRPAPIAASLPSIAASIRARSATPSPSRAPTRSTLSPTSSSARERSRPAGLRCERPARARSPSLYGVARRLAIFRTTRPGSRFVDPDPDLGGARAIPRARHDALAARPGPPAPTGPCRADDRGSNAAAFPKSPRRIQCRSLGDAPLSPRLPARPSFPQPELARGVPLPLRSGVRTSRHHQRTELQTLVRHASVLGPGSGEQGGLRLAQECRYRRHAGGGIRHLRFSDL